MYLSIYQSIPLYPLHTADTTIRDIYDYTALDYAIEKGLHYCALLLTQEGQTR